MISVPCVSPDGKPTKSGTATLSAIKNGASTPKAISEITKQPLFKVRSGLRELLKAGFVKQKESIYLLTPKGKNLTS